MDRFTMNNKDDKVVYYDMGEEMDKFEVLSRLNDLNIEKELFQKLSFHQNNKSKYEIENERLMKNIELIRLVKLDLEKENEYLKKILKDNGYEYNYKSPFRDTINKLNIKEMVY